MVIFNNKFSTKNIMLKTILQPYTNFKSNEFKPSGQSEDKTILNISENIQSAETETASEINQTERIKLIQELEYIENFLYNLGSSIRYEQGRLEKMNYARKKIESVF